MITGIKGYPRNSFKWIRIYGSVTIEPRWNR